MNTLNLMYLIDQFDFKDRFTYNIMIKVALILL